MPEIAPTSQNGISRPRHSNPSVVRDPGGIHKALSSRLNDKTSRAIAVNRRSRALSEAVETTWWCCSLSSNGPTAGGRHSGAARRPSAANHVDSEDNSTYFRIKPTVEDQLSVGYLRTLGPGAGSSVEARPVGIPASWIALHKSSQDSRTPCPLRPAPHR